MNYTKLKIFTVFAAAALMVTMFGHTQQATGISQSQGSSIVCINDECQQSKDTSQSQGSSIVCINDECEVNYSSSPSSSRDSIEEEKEDMNESIEESLADGNE
jgi:hypothetical protein